MDIFAVVSSVLYFFLHIIFFFGFIRSNSLKRNIKFRDINVTVIVAARNEDEIISRCISSLKKLNYNRDLLQIILVNDKSTDSTKSIMLNETKELHHFFIIDSDDTTLKNLKGKANAIDSAIKIAKGDIILMTDADCIIPENWVSETVKYYSENIQMVCGFTKINYKNSFFAKLQALDWIYLQSLASCSSGIGKILSCIGNNLTFTKKVYNDVGGFKNINFSVTEDLALMRKINSDKHYKVVYPINPECSVITEECKTIKELYNQKKRWFKGGLGINYLGWILGFELYIVNLILFFGILFLDFYLYFFLITIKLCSELLIILPVYFKLRFKGLLLYFPIFQIYFSIYGLLLPFTFLLSTKINWKDRKL
ncbi:MAG: glycosyltransferase [Ignavibacteria bacterium]|jgi:cellulose synthase/poly-beta-1,6-N-acetylglucosamine synthase-like glycosyltransferase